MGGDDLDRFLWKLDGHENRKQFTFERQKEGTMPFLDMLINKKQTLLLKSIPEVLIKYNHCNSNHSGVLVLGGMQGF